MQPVLSCAGREASRAPPAFVGRCSNPSQGAAVSSAFARPRARTNASCNHAGRAASSTPPALVSRRSNPSQGAAASAGSSRVPARNDASSSRAGREASRAPPAFVGRRSNPSQGAAASAAFALPHAPTNASCSRAGREASSAPPSSAAAETHQFRVPRRVPLCSGTRTPGRWILNTQQTRGLGRLRVQIPPPVRFPPKQQPALALEHTQASAPSVFITTATAATQGHAPCVPAGPDRGDAGRCARPRGVDHAMPTKVRIVRRRTSAVGRAYGRTPSARWPCGEYFF